MGCCCCCLRSLCSLNKGQSLVFAIWHFSQALGGKRTQHMLVHFQTQRSKIILSKIRQKYLRWHLGMENGAVAKGRLDHQTVLPLLWHKAPIYNSETSTILAIIQTLQSVSNGYALAVTAYLKTDLILKRLSEASFYAKPLLYLLISTLTHKYMCW